MSIKTTDGRWRTKRGLQARLVVVFTLVMIGSLIMLLFGCFHPKRPKNSIQQQVYIGTGGTTRTTGAVGKTKPLKQNYIHFGEAVAKKKLRGSKNKEAKKKAGIRSRQMMVVRAKRLRTDRERREELAYIFQDVYPSDNGGVDGEMICEL